MVSYCSLARSRLTARGQPRGTSGARGLPVLLRQWKFEFNGSYEGASKSIHALGCGRQPPDGSGQLNGHRSVIALVSHDICDFDFAIRLLHVLDRMHGPPLTDSK